MGTTARPSRLGNLKTRRSLNIAAWIIWITALLFLMLRYWSGSAHRVYAFNDYVLAGYHWIQGKYLYGNWRGFIYSPIIAAFFAPFSLLPPKLAYPLWLLLNASVFFGGLATLLQSNVIPGFKRDSFAFV